MTNTNEIGIKAEWHKAKKVLMHEPGFELVYGALHYPSTLFKGAMDVKKAIRQHRRYQNELRKEGVEVYTIKDVVSKIKKGSELRSELENLTQNLLEYSHTERNFSIEEKIENSEIKKEVIKKPDSATLLDVILHHVTYNLKDGDNVNSKYVVNDIKIQPLMNFFFSRDQQITTDKGLVMGRMHTQLRANEAEITKFAFKCMGIKPIYEATKDGFLEGGDYIPAGDFALLGVGLRSNYKAVEQLLENNVFGFNEIAVVKYSNQSIKDMHLDTWFNIIADNKAIILETLRNSPCISVDIYKKNGTNTYSLDKNQEKINFTDYITEKGFNLTNITEEEQKKFGVNILTIDNGKFIGVKGVGKNYESKFLKFDCKFIDFSELTQGYGGPHCCTQVFYRRSA